VNRISLGVLAILLAATGRTALAAAPSGQTVPILYNDRHVYAAPDLLKQGRVLAALVRGSTLLIPLRSMFEQMGATVSYDPATKTATVSKPGAEVRVTVGKAEVVVNGQSRPLDVPPMLYRGSVLVPVRVISEGMGAYVQWVPDQHVVVVRYLQATPPPPPSPAPTPVPTEAPTPLPTPTPMPPYNDLYVAGDYLISPKAYNEFSPGNTGSGSWAARGAWEFSAFAIPFMVEGSWQQNQYPHNGSSGNLNAPCNGVGGNAAPGSAGCVTIIGGGNTINIAPFTARDSDFDARLGMKLLKQRVYLAFAYRWTSSNYGYPNMQGFGEGIEKLPDLDQALSFFGSWMYYPKISGKMTTGIPATPYNLQYILTTYQIGAAYAIGTSPVFVEAGWMGDAWVNRENAPGNRSDYGAFAGLGVKFP